MMMMNDNNIKSYCNNNRFIIRVANEHDSDAVLEFIRKFYYPEEPITLGNEPKQQSEEDEKFHISLLPMGSSIVATDSERNDQIVGALIAGPVEPSEAEEMLEQAKLCKDKKWSEILYLLAYLDMQANIYKRYNVDRALYVHAIAVDDQTRGQAIGAKMMEKCMEIGKAMGYSLLSGDFTSVYSIRMAEKLDMDCVGDLAYEDYKDDDGNQLFRPPVPHM